MFYDRVYAVCKEKNTSPSAVLSALGCSTGNISKWKSGSVPNLDLASKIASHLGVSLDYLVYGNESRNEHLAPTSNLDLEECDFYYSVKKICFKKDVRLSIMIRDLHLDIGCVGQWKEGVLPTVDVAFAIARYLGVSLDYLITGLETDDSMLMVSGLDPEWIDIITHIPDDKQGMCKDFLRTHMVIPEKYEKRKRG